MGKDKGLKIAFIFNQFFPEKGGESYFAWLTKQLSSMGHEIHIYGAYGIEDKYYKFHKVPVIAYPPSIRLLSFFFNSKRLLQKESFDIIHGVGHTTHMNLFNPHGGVERAYLRQEFYSIKNRGYLALRYMRRHLGLRHYLLMWIQKAQYENPMVKRIIAISPMIKEHILHYFSVPEEKIRVVVNCVDLQRFNPENRRFRKNIREKMGIDDDTILLLFAGNNFRLKGLEPLILALSLINKREKTRVKLVVAGRGRKRRYENIAKKEEVFEDVIFLGPTKHMERLYGASDIYVHPTFYDSCSLTVLEALATGIPVVTSRFNGAHIAITSEKAGSTINDPWDIEELSGAIVSFFDRRLRKEAQDVARGCAERFSPSYNLEGTLDAYYEVLKGTIDKSVNWRD